MNLWLIAGLLMAWSGMLSLCLGLERHYKQLWQSPPGTGLRRLLRASGWLWLLAAFACCVQAWGWAMAAPGWLGLVSMAGLVLVLLLPYALKGLVWVSVLGWPVIAVAVLM